MMSAWRELFGFYGKLDFFQCLGLLTVIRTALHRSKSERRKHNTARGFVEGRGAFTIHVDRNGGCLGVFDNVGEWTDIFFDIYNECDGV
jgi:hypothetical protein